MNVINTWYVKLRDSSWRFGLVLLAPLSFWILLGSLSARARPPAAAPQESPLPDLTRELLDNLSLPPVGQRDKVPDGDRTSADQRSILVNVAHDMADVAERLRAKRVAADTQAMQAGIVEQLERLIAQHRTQKTASSSAGGEGRGRQPAYASSRRPGNAASSPSDTEDTDGNPFANDSLGSIWGHLPEQMQPQIRSPVHEEFLPSYRQLITEYYKRLTED